MPSYYIIFSQFTLKHLGINCNGLHAKGKRCVCMQGSRGWNKRTGNISKRSQVSLPCCLGWVKIRRGARYLQGWISWRHLAGNECYCIILDAGQVWDGRGKRYYGKKVTRSVFLDVCTELSKILCVIGNCVLNILWLLRCGWTSNPLEGDRNNATMWFMLQTSCSLHFYDPSQLWSDSTMIRLNYEISKLCEGIKIYQS